jgi:membrane-associated phospholipid phosphatase
VHHVQDVVAGLALGLLSGTAGILLTAVLAGVFRAAHGRPISH